MYMEKVIVKFRLQSQGFFNVVEDLSGLDRVATCQEKEKSQSRNLFDSGKTDVLKKSQGKLK